MNWMRTSLRLVCLLSFLSLASCGNDDNPGKDDTSNGGGTGTPTEPATENELKQLLTKNWDFGKQAPYENLRLFEDMSYSLRKRPQAKADVESEYITGTYEIGGDLKTVKLNGFGTMKLTSVGETDLSFTLTPDNGDPVDLTCSTDNKEIEKPVIFEGKRVATITENGRLRIEMTYSGEKLATYRTYGSVDVPVDSIGANPDVPQDSTGMNPDVPQDSTGFDPEIPQDSVRNRMAGLFARVTKADSTGTDAPSDILLDALISYTEAEVKITGVDFEKGPFISTYILNEKGLAVSMRTVYEQNGDSETAEFTYVSGDYLAGYTLRENGTVFEDVSFAYNNGELTRIVYGNYSKGVSNDHTYHYMASDKPNKGGIMCFDIAGESPFAIAYYAGILGKPTGHLVTKATDQDGGDTVEYGYTFDQDGYVQTSVLTGTYASDQSTYTETYGYTFQ